ncbi:phage holin, LLH family [Paenibacillus sp. SYP-B4298]|uniref:phage holin, LLH family n=1 Tax=Paenibacillus sp. SYP-B4298 TaxID=2996034 RepID=UPI0022DE73FB|nr:phage holin, LLH family [Paenibacillus sp. SYP-B4298]
MHAMLQPYLQTIVLAILSVLASVATAALFQARARMLRWLESRATNEQRELLHKLAGEAFAFAETVFREVGGPKKLEAAYGYLSTRLKEQGIELGQAELRSAIEKAVLDYNALQAPLLGPSFRSQTKDIHEQS